MSTDATGSENNRKLERIDIRIPAETKSIIQRAAETKGVSTTSFVIAAAYDAAQATLLGVEIMRLSPEQSLRFIESLEDAPEPNVALRNLLGNRQATDG